MKTATRFFRLLAFAVLLFCAGCQATSQRPVGQINYDYFDLKFDYQPDGAVELRFTYTGPAELSNVSLLPIVVPHQVTGVWMPEPAWQEYETWKPQETKVMATDEQFRKGSRVIRVKLVLKAEFEGKRVYVTKTFNYLDDAASPPAPSR